MPPGPRRWPGRGPAAAAVFRWLITARGVHLAGGPRCARAWRPDVCGLLVLARGQVAGEQALQI